MSKSLHLHLGEKGKKDEGIEVEENVKSWKLVKAIKRGLGINNVKGIW